MPGARIAVLGGVRGGAWANPGAGGLTPSAAVPAPAMSPASPAGGGTTPTTGQATASASMFRPPLTSAKIHKWVFAGSVAFLLFTYWSLPQ